MNNFALQEHLAFQLNLELNEVCNCISSALKFPGFKYDCENETEWGLVDVDGIEYNVSRPYNKGTLQEWDNTVPLGCNFAITLGFHLGHKKAKDRNWVIETVVDPFAQTTANVLGVTVYYHRTWFGAGKNTKRTRAYKPVEV